jgi:heme A synthase
MRYSVYTFSRQALKSLTVGGSTADAAVEFANRMLTGLAGILVTIWAGLRGLSKDVQRAVFHPVAVAIFLMTAL